MIRNDIINILPIKIREVIYEYPYDFDKIEEIRLRCNKAGLLIGREVVADL